jgi:hypothetical protein
VALFALSDQPAGHVKVEQDFFGLQQFAWKVVDVIPDCLSLNFPINSISSVDVLLQLVWFPIAPYRQVPVVFDT